MTYMDIYRSMYIRSIKRQKSILIDIVNSFNNNKIHVIDIVSSEMVGKVEKTDGWFYKYKIYNICGDFIRTVTTTELIELYDQG